MHLSPLASVVSTPQWVAVMSMARSALYAWSMLWSRDKVQPVSKIVILGFSTTDMNSLSELRPFCDSVTRESSQLKEVVREGYGTQIPVA
jgi:hypothetical protein